MRDDNIIPDNETKLETFFWNAGVFRKGGKGTREVRNDARRFAVVAMGLCLGFAALCAKCSHDSLEKNDQNKTQPAQPYTPLLLP